MKPCRCRAASMAPLLAMLAASCGPQRVPPPVPASVTRSLVVLLPDGADGTVGRATVSNAAGSITMTNAREATTVAAQQPPSPAIVMNEADVQALFGAVVSALPPAAQHFALYFRNESELTEESRALVPDVIQAVRRQPAADVAVVGHTDTTGSAARNVEVGLMRANLVRDLLIAAGLDIAVIEASSHGEADLLVATADEVFEPRNRRVEITVR